MTQAQDFAERFNDLEFVKDRVMEAFVFFKELGKASDYVPEDYQPKISDYADIANPAFTIFADAHIEGVYTFSDGSKMRISRLTGSTERKASVL